MAARSQQLTPEELLARVAKRDTNALGELYDQFAPRLYRILLRILSDRPAAEQILEDIFTELWNETRRLRYEPASVAAWLTITTRSTAIARLRGERELPRGARDAPIPLEKARSCLPGPEEVALLEERRELLKKVVSQLPAAQRQALELLVFEGYTESEVARKLGEPLGKAKTGLRAGLAFLRHRLRAVLGTWAVNI